eukprot:Skav235007  [mRNA]  locus=scaffold276:84617:89027:+ [translate_table: standard]
MDHTVFGPDWATTSVQDQVSFVLTDVVWAEQMGIGKTVPGQVVVKIFGDVPNESESFDRVTVVEGTIVTTVPGFKAVGFVPRCAVEQQHRLADLHSRLHPQVPVINADITQDATVKLIWKECPEPCTVMSGVSCQPYSRGGSQRGGDDSRSGTFPASLRIAHFLQARILVIECVTPAKSDAFVRRHVQNMIQCIGYRVVDCELKLEDMWAAHRFRWWLVATHPCLGVVQLSPPPMQSNLTVRDVMPFIKRWPQDDEAQLCLTPAEQARFALAGQPLRHYAVKLNQKLPTALHSWGGQTRACACLCREQGFSDDSLRTRGIYAQLLALPPGEDGLIQFRHMHVIEVALLNGVPIDLDWSPDQRLNLCAIGQMAAPMQSLWIGAHIWLHIDTFFGNGHAPTPVEHLMRFKQVLWSQVAILVEVKVLWLQLPHQLAQTQPDEPDFPSLWDDFPEPSGGTPTGMTRHHAHVEGLAPRANTVDPAAEASDSMHAEGLTESMTPASTTSALDDPAATVATGTMHPGGHAFDTAFAAMVNLSASQLVKLVTPLVYDSHLCAAMRSQQVPVHQRTKMFDQQLHTWGDDEVLWHFIRLQAVCQDVGVVFVDPLLMTGWAQSSDSQHMQAFMSQFHDVKKVISAVLWRGHWTPYQWEVHHNTLRVTSWDHTAADINPMNALHGFMCLALKVGSFEITCERRQFGSQMCGAATIAFAEAKVLHRALPSSASQLQQRHDEFKQSFRKHLAVLGQCTKPWCWGEGVTDVHGPLAALLQVHGVPAANATQRAKLVAQALGKEDIHKALSSPEPWKTLKHIANQHKPLIQLVMADEQQQVVLDRQGKGRSKNKQNSKGRGKGKGKPVAAPPELDASKLQLLDNAFRTKDNDSVQQIMANQVGPLAQGIAIMSVHDAKPFMQSTQLLTDKALALLVLNPPDTMPCSMLCTKIRFAAKCTFNQEPMLLTAALVQLGGTIVEQVQVSPNASITAKEVACARFVAFKDQWPQDWSHFVSKPVKAILDAVVPLQLCREDDCECGRFHADPMQDTSQLVLDVFRRQFFADSGKPVKPDQATHFAVVIRYQKSQEQAVLQLSGQGGLFVEPRVESGLEPSKEYQVVWIPQASYAEAQHKLQCEPHGLGLARTQHRYGIRVKSCHFQPVFQSLKPDGLFLAPGERLQWHTGPWPYGFDRKMLAKQFKEWGWQARPLQPSKSVEGGVMWLTQSVEAPSQSIWQLPHGPVMITRHEASGLMGDQSSPVIGQQATVQLCASSAPTDPWLVTDPWTTAPKACVAAQATPQGPDRLQELEKRLEQSILAKLPQETMEVDDQDSRLQILEQQVQALSHQQQTMERVVTENHRQLSTQHQHLEQVVNEHHQQNTAQVQALNSQMATQLDVQRMHMQEMFQQQMTQLEAILKKPRNE